MICDSDQNSADTDASVHRNLGMMQTLDLEPRTENYSNLKLFET